jgi:hypothetical protein
MCTEQSGLQIVELESRRIWLCQLIFTQRELYEGISKSFRSEVKGKVVPCALTEHHTMKAYWRVEVYSTHSLTSSLDGGEWSALCPSRFTPKEKAHGTYWIGSWVGTRAVLDAVVKRKIPSPRRESNPRTPIIHR